MLDLVTLRPLAHLDRRGLARVRGIPSVRKPELVVQREPLGFGHAVLTAKRAVGDEPFAMLLPDDLINGARAQAIGVLSPGRGGALQPPGELVDHRRAQLTQSPQDRVGFAGA